MSLKLNSSGGGSVTLQEPSTASNRTLTLPDSTGTIATAESTLSQFNASGSAPVYAARAWVNFNGTGTVAIRASGNVTSITDNGTGDYTVNITTAMPDANYAVTCMAGGTSSIGWSRLADTPAPTTSAYRIYVANAGGTVLLDAAFVNVAIFR